MRRYTRIRHHKRLPSRVLLALRRRGKRAVSFLARACFSVSETAPMVTPHIAEDGSSWTIVDVEGDKCHNEDNSFIIDALDTTGYDRAKIYNDVGTVVAGTALVITTDELDDGSAKVRVGFQKTLGNDNIGFYLNGYVEIRGLYVPNWYTPVCSSLAGELSVIIGDNQIFWVVGKKIVYMRNVEDDISAWHYAKYFSYSGGSAMSSIGSLNLTANGYKKWASSFAHETDSLSAPASGTEYSEPEGHHVHYEFTYEAGKYVIINDTLVDTNNFLQVRVETNGNLIVKKYVGGSADDMLIAIGVFLDGVAYSMDLIVSSGNRILLFVNGASKLDTTESDITLTTTGKIYHTLATNDIELTTHPYPALGIATSRTIWPQTGDTQTAKADVWLDLESVTLPSVGTNRIQVSLRKTTTTDIVKIYIYGDGRVIVYDVVGNVYYNRINGVAGTVSNGNRIALHLEGAVGRLYVDNGFVNSSNSFVNQTQSDFKYDSRGVDGIISAVTCYPIDCSRLLPTIPDCPNTVLTYLTNDNNDEIYAGSDRIGGW